MPEHLFMTPQAPTAEELHEALGKTAKHWDELVRHALEAAPGAKADWKKYGKNSGWIQIIKGKKNNLLYLRPLENAFMANMALNEKAYAAALDADLPAPVIEALQSAPKYPEGRPARIEVRRPSDLKTVKALLALKLES